MPSIILWRYSEVILTRHHNLIYTFVLDLVIGWWSLSPVSGSPTSRLMRLLSLSLYESVILKLLKLSTAVYPMSYAACLCIRLNFGVSLNLKCHAGSHRCIDSVQVYTVFLRIFKVPFQGELVNTSSVSVWDHFENSEDDLVVIFHRILSDYGFVILRMCSDLHNWLLGQSGKLWV